MTNPILIGFADCPARLLIFDRILTLCTRETPKRVLLQSEDPDEMQHHAAFHQGLHCL